MSSQRGNIKKQGPPKHQNKFAFKFDLHDATPKTKLIKTVELNGLCQRCKEVIDWKIKYKKYKPLTVPKKCTKCSLKAIKQAYYTMCVPCATANHVCAKCGEKSDVISK
ncbi:hypothetical protein FSP39_001090 [Pinctada imbricata]|uniref:Uncharacterized protein n=1 Tax=Pinctada imbricata TaxID=66713 RepID=A0AA88YC94_PINIB|nr:hypothetical protein FSP39_001090 [Pinctada imbricata]